MKKHAIVNLMYQTPYQWNMKGEATAFSTHQGLAVYLGRDAKDTGDVFLKETGRNGFYDDPFEAVCLRGEYEAKSVRGLPAEAREILTQIAKEYDRERLLKSEIQSLNSDIRDIQRDRKSLYSDLTAARGLLAKEQFGKEVYEALPSNVRNAMSCGGWQIEEPVGIGYKPKDLQISRDVHIQKYAQPHNYPFLYTEYDGTLAFYSDYKKDPTYQSLIAKNHKELPIKAELSETIDLGDKNTLSYSACYSIPLTKDMTSEYAKEIANKIAGVPKSKGLAGMMEQAEAGVSRNSVRKEDIEFDR